jgi:tetratricopeptide (TPR) repeat protein
MREIATAVAVAVLICSVPSAHADPLPRSSPAAGSVIARKTGEQVRFIEIANWRGVDVDQDLLAGDVLRTNARGNLAILFSDNTQIRLGRNTTMVVKDVTPGADSAFTLESGSLWARAERGGEGIVIDTPAAAAAIRGTDWTMTVDGDRTSLVVLEGVVELSNAQGSVRVTRGEAASARIGQAPSKTVVVAPDDREQMLFYLSLRNGFAALPASPLSSTDMAQARRRIAATPEAARTAEDWITLAEVSLSFDGNAAAVAASEQAPRFARSPSQQARLDLVAGLVAAMEKRYDAAEPLLQRATPRLDARRRAVAAYAAYFVRSLADPTREEQPPRIADGGPYGALAEAWTAGFLQDIPAAIAVVRRAEQSHPDDPTLPAVRAQLALLLDDRDEMKQAIDRALALDPDHPTALEARANYRAGIEGDMDGALADLERASLLAPGSSTVWNGLGLVLSARGANREAEAALQRAIELDPLDPVSHANLALVYLEQNRLAEAKREIDTAIAADAEFAIGLVARGAYHLKNGDLDKAREDLLAGSTANPAYAQALLLLAIAYSEAGEREPAEQALENADRLDPNDPVIPTFEAALAIDDYDSDRAIRAAQEALKRARARGGDYASLSASRDQGSTLNHAYRLQGLDAWGRYYGDAVFDPFSASALVDQGLAGSPVSFVNSLTYGQNAGDPAINQQYFGSVLQALLLDPQMLASPTRGSGLVQRPFFEATIGGGGVAGAADGWIANGEVQGYTAYPFPVSFYGQINASNTEETRQGTTAGASAPNTQFDMSDDIITGVGYVTAQPTPNDRLVAFANIQNVESRMTDAFFVPVPPIPIGGGFDLIGVAYDRDVEDRTGSYGAGWSHTFGYRNVTNAALFVSGFDRTSTEASTIVIDSIFGPIFGSASQAVDYTQRSVMGAVNHLYGIGDDFTLRYGAEGGTFRQDREQTDVSLIPGLPPTVTTSRADYDLTAFRAYADAIYEVTPSIKLEAGLFGTVLDGEGLDVQRLEPRAGVAWTPYEGHSLRAGYLRESSQINAATLEPIGVVGLQSNQLPFDVGGYADTFAARWDAQWTDNVFTAVDYQHQDAHDLAITIPASLDQLYVDSGRIDRLSLTANVWLTHGIGAFATYSRIWSENTSEGADGQTIPFVPGSVARLGLTWVSTADLRVTAAATYVGERAGDLANLSTLAGYWTADAFITWEPMDKRFTLEFAAYNLLDETFEVAPYVPGWGRTFTGSLKLRF